MNVITFGLRTSSAMRVVRIVLSCLVLTLAAGSQTLAVEEFRVTAIDCGDASGYPDQGAIDIFGLAGRTLLIYPDRSYTADGVYPLPPGTYTWSVLEQDGPQGTITIGLCPAPSVCDSPAPVGGGIGAPLVMPRTDTE